MQWFRNPQYPRPMVTRQYAKIEKGHAPAASNRGVSRNRSPEIQAVAIYDPLARRQKLERNQAQGRLNRQAISPGTSAPRMGPDQRVRSGIGSGSYKLCGKCHGHRSASINVAPPSQPPRIWPHSCVVVIVHHATISSPKNLPQRFNTAFRSMLKLPFFVSVTIQHHPGGSNERYSTYPSLSHPELWPQSVYV